MFCVHCGSQIPDNARFCGSCGKAIPQEPEVQPAAPVGVEPIPEPVMQAVEPVMEQPAPVYAPAYTQASAVATAPAPKKKSKKGLVIAIVLILVAALLAAGGYFGYRYYTQLQRYEKACSLMEAGEYEDALLLLEKMDFKDSKKKVAQLQDLIEEAKEDDDDQDDGQDDDQDNPNTDDDAQLLITPAELTYQLTDADLEAFYRLLADAEFVALADKDRTAADKLATELDDQFMYIESQYSTAMVLYYCDLEDEAASQLYLDCTDIYTQTKNDYLEMLRNVYQSESSIKDVFFDEWTEQEIAMLLSYTSEVMELEQRNSEIEVAYQDMQGDDSMYDAMVPLYIEMVQNNNRIAQIYGYENYYEYAYELVYLRDYDPSQIQQMRQYVATYLSPALEDAMDNFSGGMSELSMIAQMNVSTFIMESYTDTNKPYVEDYILSRPASMRDSMLHMFNGNILMKDDVSTAMEGAFTATIGEDRAVCFFGPGYSNSTTIIHELGHYYGSLYTYMDEMPLDLAETQSQGNEWLFLRYLEGEMNDSTHDAIESYKLYSDVASIVICMLVDEFEQQVYSHPDVASLTGADLDAIMEQVCQAYGGIDYLEDVATDVQEYWRMVVIEQPVYYISYAVSGIAAMDIYAMSDNDPDGALAVYRSLIENVDLDQGFLGNITNAGISGPFDEDVYKAICDMISD